MKRTKLKDLLGESVLGILPSSKLMKMKWNPLKTEDHNGHDDEEEESDQFSYAGEFGDDDRPPVEDEDKAEQETERMAGHEDDEEIEEGTRPMRPSIEKLLKQKGYDPIFHAIDKSKRQFKQMKYTKGEIEDTLFDMFGNTDPKIVKKITETINKKKTPSLKSMVNEHLLGELPSEKLMKMKWNPVTQTEPIKERASLGGMSEIIVWDHLGDSFENLLNDLSELAYKTTDPKWEKALKVVHDQLRKVEDKLSTYDRKLGIIELK